MDFSVWVAHAETMTDSRATTYDRAPPGAARRSEDNGKDRAERETPAGTEAGPRGATLGAWLTLVVVAGGLFLAVMSTTVVSVALPTIGRDLHASSTGLEWIVDAYVVVYASLLLPGGALGDRLGRKGLFLFGVGLFGLGSAMAALAPSVAVLLVGRVIQGLGPALLVPGSLTISGPPSKTPASGRWPSGCGPLRPGWPWPSAPLWAG